MKILIIIKYLLKWHHDCLLSSSLKLDTFNLILNIINKNLEEVYNFFHSIFLKV